MREHRREKERWNERLRKNIEQIQVKEGEREELCVWVEGCGRLWWIGRREKSKWWYSAFDDGCSSALSKMKSGIGRHLLIIEIHLHAPLEEVEGKLDFKCADKIQFKYKQCGLVNTPPCVWMNIYCNLVFLPFIYETCRITIETHVVIRAWNCIVGGKTFKCGTYIYWVVKVIGVNPFLSEVTKIKKHNAWIYNSNMRV